MMSTTVKAKKANRIALGSGKMYCIEESETVKLTSAMTIETVLKFVEDNVKEDNILGRIKNGATYNYNFTTYTEKDDFNEVSKTTTTDENVTLGAGFITFDLSMLQKLIATLQHESDENGNEMAKIGGIKHDNGKKYIIIFVHEDKTDGDIIVMIRGKNTGAIALAFANGAGTMTNPVFTAEPFDTDGVTSIILNRAPGYKVSQTETTQTEPETTEEGA